MYCAIIGDIVNSKKVKNRHELQVRLKKTLMEVTQKYDEDIAAKFTITLGDEFQGLLKDPSRLLAMINDIKMRMHPVQVRFGIGFGNISTEINRELAIGADGPAYYHARSAIESIKKLNQSNDQPLQNIKIEADTSGHSCLDLINATLSTCYFIEEKWSEKQREVIQMLSEVKLTQLELATSLGLSQSSVYRRLNAAGYRTYRYATDMMTEQINALWEVLHAT